MDVFTILVFFLLVNAGGAQQPSSSQLKLPKAKVATPLADDLVIAVNEKSITVQGRRVADVAAVLEQADDVIPGLLEELSYQLDRGSSVEVVPTDESATVMADRKIPFVLLHRIMATASEAGYGQISLAVIGEAVGKG
jgi:biopolymer transport protein ExbD